MIRKIFITFIIILTPVFLITNVNATSTVNAASNSENNKDCTNGIKLNTNIPGVGKCIEKDKVDDAFGTLMGGLMKLALNITVAIAFLALIASGIMMSVSGVSQSTAGKGKELIKKVILGIVLLGLSGLILHTINPNFFKTSVVLQEIKILKL